MGVVNLFFESENIDVKRDIVDKYLTSIDERMLNNPNFIRELSKEVSSLTRRKNYNDRIPPLELYISDDGKSFELRTSIIKDPDCLNDDLENNKHFKLARFNLDEKTNGMDITMFSGTLYKFDDYMKVVGETEHGNKFKVFNSHDTPTVLSVYHTNKQILESGVEVAMSTYSDTYPLGMNMDQEQQLKTQIVYEHAPQQWKYNLVPSSARYEFDPQKTNAHRYINEMGLVNYQSTSGKNNPIKAAVYPSGTEYPDLLTSSPTPLIQYENGKEELTSSYLEEFPGMNVWEIRKQMNIMFAKGIETSKTKDINQAAYEGIKSVTLDGLQNKYGISLSEEDLSHSISR